MCWFAVIAAVVHLTEIFHQAFNFYNSRDAPPANSFTARALNIISVAKHSLGASPDRLLLLSFGMAVCSLGALCLLFCTLVMCSVYY